MVGGRVNTYNLTDNAMDSLFGPSGSGKFGHPPHSSQRRSTYVAAVFRTPRRCAA